MLANPEGDPDPDLDLAGHEKPKWTRYSLRRAGERSARNNQHRHGLPRAEIDLYSGWDLYEHSRDMQLHYPGRTGSTASNGATSPGGSDRMT